MAGEAKPELAGGVGEGLVAYTRAAAAAAAAAGSRRLGPKISISAAAGARIGSMSSLPPAKSGGKRAVYEQQADGAYSWSSPDDFINVGCKKLTAKGEHGDGWPAKTGWLYKEGHVRKNWKRRFFVLWPSEPVPKLGQLLLYYTDPDGGAPKGIIPLCEFNIVTPKTQREFEHCFRITIEDYVPQGSHRKYIIASENQDTLLEWSTAIQQNTDWESAGAGFRPSMVGKATPRPSKTKSATPPPKPKGELVEAGTAAAVGMTLDVRSGTGEWRSVTVVQLKPAEAGDAGDAEGEAGEGAKLKIYYDGFKAEYDEWVAVGDAERVRMETLRAEYVPPPLTEEEEFVARAAAAIAASSASSADGGAGTAHLPEEIGGGGGRSSRAASDASMKSTSRPPSTSSGPRRATKGDFEFEHKIGKGAFADVVTAKRTKDGKLFAVKVLDKSHIIRNNKIKYVKIERDVLTLLNSPYVVRLVSTFQDRDSLYYVMEYCPGGELLRQIQRRPGGRAPMADVQFWVAELVMAIAYIGKKGIVHRDLKPENTLLSESGHVKLCDFGTAKLMQQDSGGKDKDDEEGASSFEGTAEYVSPEVIDGSYPISPSADLWALGCMIYQCFTGVPPFRASGSEYATMQLISARDFEFPADFPAVAQDLVDKLLQLDPEKRIGHGEIDRGLGVGLWSIKSHPFFEGIDFDSLQDATPPLVIPMSEEELASRQEALMDEFGSLM